MRESPIIRYQEERAFEKRLRDIITELRKGQTTQIQQVYSRFYDCIKVSGQEDSTYLPYTINKYFRCSQFLLLLRPNYYIRLSLNYTFYLWREYLCKKIGPKRIKHCCNYFEQILAVGVENYKIIGNIRIGWRLKYDNSQSE